MKFLLFTLFLLCTPALGFAQNFYYLDIREIPGGSTDAQYEDQICISSFSWGVDVESRPAGGGGSSTGVATQEDFLMGKSLDIATVDIYEAITRGQAFPEATLSIIGTGDTGLRYKVAEYEFTNLRFVGLQPGGATDGMSKEVISLTADQVQISYFAQNGALLSEFAWNFRTNSIP